MGTMGCMYSQEGTRAASWTPYSRAFRFDHELDGDPLFKLDALADLADRMDPSKIEVTDALSETVVTSRATQRLLRDGPRSPGDIVRSIEAEGRWMSMRNIETDAAYSTLIERVFSEFKAGLPTDAEVFQPEGYVFIGASNATTPAHVDHEHNLFFQLRGEKAFTTGSFPDADLEHRTFEGMYSGEYGSTDFAPVTPRTDKLQSGDGLYVPPNALHYVENSGSLAISFSLVFHDTVLDRTAKTYLANARLRSIGLSPRPPGRSVALDRSKEAAVDGWRRLGPLRQKLQSLR